MAHAELIDWDAVTTVVMQQEHEAMMARAAQCRRDNEVIVAFGQWLNEATWGRATGPFVFPPTMTPDEIRDYCMDYMDPELHTWSELLHQIGRTLSAQGHGIDACQNERERAGWEEASADADQDDAQRHRPAAALFNNFNATNTCRRGGDNHGDEHCDERSPQPTW